MFARGLLSDERMAGGVIGVGMAREENFDVHELRPAQHLFRRDASTTGGTPALHREIADRDENHFGIDTPWPVACGKSFKMDVISGNTSPMNRRNAIAIDAGRPLPLEERCNECVGRVFFSEEFFIDPWPWTDCSL